MLTCYALLVTLKAEILIYVTKEVKICIKSDYTVKQFFCIDSELVTVVSIKANSLGKGNIIKRNKYMWAETKNSFVNISPETAEASGNDLEPVKCNGVVTVPWGWVVYWEDMSIDNWLRILSL